MNQSDDHRGIDLAGLPKGWNRASTTKMVREILGPQARTWSRDGRVSIGYQRGGSKLVLAVSGDRNF